MDRTGKTVPGAVHNPGSVFIKAELTVSSDGLSAVLMPQDFSFYIFHMCVILQFFSE